jgi:RimJ/RimL family protein N-acetyltransferase
MKLKVLTADAVEQVRQWRNDCLEALRTPYPLTKEMQEQFYRNVICDRNARAKYWGIWEEMSFPYDPELMMRLIPPLKEKEYKATILIGMCGLENIEWENGRAEISLILNPQYQKKGYGEKALELLLTTGFYEMGLRQVWGECYTCNDALSFWQKAAERHKGHIAIHKMVKYWCSAYWDSLYFSFERSDFCDNP